LGQRGASSGGVCVPKISGGFNTTVKPFTDVRVRKALTLGVDRYTMGKVLYPLTGLKNVGGLIRPDSEWGMAPAELELLPSCWPRAR
jgi:peptide/nickel transport system substrate-binding protein